MCTASGLYCAVVPRHFSASAFCKTWTTSLQYEHRSNQFRNILHISRLQTQPQRHHMQFLPNCFGPEGLLIACSISTEQWGDGPWTPSSLQIGQKSLKNIESESTYSTASNLPCSSHPPQGNHQLLTKRHRAHKGTSQCPNIPTP